MGTLKKRAFLRFKEAYWDKTKNPKYSSGCIEDVGCPETTLVWNLEAPGKERVGMAFWVFFFVYDCGESAKKSPYDLT